MSFFNRPLNHLNLNVPNIDKAIDFYTKILNYSIIDQYENNGMRFAFLTDGNIVYEFMENPSVNKIILDHIAYASEDIEADYQYFKNLDEGLLLGEIGYVDFLFENGVYFFFIKGANGEKIEFCQRKTN